MDFSIISRPAQALLYSFIFIIFLLTAQSYIYDRPRSMACFLT